MATLDTPLRKVARTVIGRFGKTMTLRRPATAGGTYNTATLAVDVGAGADTDQSVKGVVESYSAGERSATVLAGDLKVTIAATDSGLTTTPSTKDRLVIDSVVYQIVSVESVMSGDYPAAYTLQVRR